MLVEFSVENFRSIAERQTFSMVPARMRKRPNLNARATNHPGVPFLLNSACIIGANGSGKSTFVKALNFFQDFVEDSANDRQASSKIGTTPFCFDRQWDKAPSRFEIIFMHGDTLYQYGFTADNERIHEEWLYERPADRTARTRTFFTRNYVAEQDKYEWYLNKNYLKGPRETWRISTRPNALFLSTANQLNAEPLKAAFQWIELFLRPIQDVNSINDGFLVSKIVEDGWKGDILDILRKADLDFNDIIVEVDDFDPSDIPSDFPHEIAEKIKKELRGSKIIKKIETTRIINDGREVGLNLDEESSGTQVMFKLAAPLIDTIRHGYTLIIDELQNSLHPLALEYVVSLFSSEEARASGAQLIFTSHETTILNKDFMDQDQIWLVEKDDDLKSHIKPLSDFDLRHISSYQKAYLDGRFGAIPIIDF